MKITESRVALYGALKDVSGLAEERGITAEVKCFIADHDLCEISEDNLGAAALVSGEITLFAEGSDKKMILECALSITDGEVSPDEMLREVTAVRDNMKQILEKLDETKDVEKAFASFEPEEEPVADEPKYDNKKFYIYAGLAVAVILLLVLLFK
ncbi:MAG: hypothetical protein IJY23_07520 [Clostridia bacterium]|nr:hypothetical protein [Clostridia bacterium]